MPGALAEFYSNKKRSHLVFYAVVLASSFLFLILGLSGVLSYAGISIPRALLIFISILMTALLLFRRRSDMGNSGSKLAMLFSLFLSAIALEVILRK